jgi:glycine/D-amino acid oxidase-like deaminating enzyme
LKLRRALAGWSGQVLEPIDYTAFIGRSPGRNRIFLATGDSGQGLTHGDMLGYLAPGEIAAAERLKPAGIIPALCSPAQSD